MPGFSNRLGRVQVAASVQMSIRARELRAQGVDIISLTLGEGPGRSPGAVAIPSLGSGLSVLGTPRSVCRPTS